MERVEYCNQKIVDKIFSVRRCCEAEYNMISIEFSPDAHFLQISDIRRKSDRKLFLYLIRRLSYPISDPITTLIFAYFVKNIFWDDLLSPY